MTATTVYAEIVKAERNAAGDLVVVGKATGPDLDLDQQICDPSWLGKAMPEWMSSAGNIREQHSSIAAGVATELAQLGDAWMVTATVVDPVSAKKVEAGVLKGYSIGIKAPQVVKDVGAPGGRIVGGQIVEVSLVDRPCNPTCTLTLAKAAKPGMTLKAVDLDAEHMLVKVEEFTEQEPGGAGPDTAKRDVSTDERDRLAGRGAAMPDGSYPIANVNDLRNAIRAIGRAKNPAAVKAHIKRRAAALGKADLVPDDWKTPVADTSKDDGEMHDPGQVTAVRDGLIALIKAELDELENGEDELCDVSELLCALKMLMCWWADEATEGEVAAPYTEGTTDSGLEHVMLTVNADGTTTKTSPAGDQPAGVDRLTELVKTAITEANQASDERIKALEAELAKVKALPAPGGPVLTRTSQDTANAAAHDRLRSEAERFRTLAYQVDDATARQGYLNLAAECDAKATTQKG
jgi:hypothetical protein